MYHQKQGVGNTAPRFPEFSENGIEKMKVPRAMIERAFSMMLLTLLLRTLTFASRGLRRSSWMRKKGGES